MDVVFFKCDVPNGRMLFITRFCKSWLMSDINPAIKFICLLVWKILCFSTFAIHNISTEITFIYSSQMRVTGADTYWSNNVQKIEVMFNWIKWLFWIISIFFSMAWLLFGFSRNFYSTYGKNKEVKLLFGQIFTFCIEFQY